MPIRTAPFIILCVYCSILLPSSQSVPISNYPQAPTIFSLKYFRRHLAHLDISLSIFGPFKDIANANHIAKQDDKSTRQRYTNEDPPLTRKWDQFRRRDRNDKVSKTSIKLQQTTRLLYRILKPTNKTETVHKIFDGEGEGDLATPTPHTSYRQLLWVPVGLIMLCCGYLVLLPFLCITAFTLGGNICYTISKTLFHNIVIQYSTSFLGAFSSLLLVLDAIEYGGYPIGVVMGILVTLAIYPFEFFSWTAVDDVFMMHVLGFTVMCVLFSLTFGILYKMVPREVSVFVTAYGGSFAIWHGLGFFSIEVFKPNWKVTDLVMPTSIDLWFNVMSFTVVGLIGVSTQLLLIKGHVQRSRYIDIP